MECMICHKLMEYYAVGNNCDHILCSLCRVRISFKLSDHSCPLCKNTSPFHVISKVPSPNSTSTALLSSHIDIHLKVFADFNLWVGKNAEGVIYDDKTGYHYIDCPNHQQYIESLIGRIE